MADSLTPLIAQVQALDEKATKGPWFQSVPPWQPDTRFVYAGSKDPHAAELVADVNPSPDIPERDD